VTSIQKNINFLEYPLFFPTKSKYLTEWGNDTYSIESKLGLPTNMDVNLLNGILLQAQATTSPIVKFTNFRDVVESAGYNRRSFSYEDIEVSLYKWRNTRIEFKKFYEDKEYCKKTFNKVITQINHSVKDNSLSITLDKSFYTSQLNKYSKSINLSLYNKLSPTAKRIYEILIKTFYHRSKWVVGCETFLDKIPILNEAEKKDNKSNLKKYLFEINSLLNLHNFVYNFHLDSLREKDLIVFNLVQTKWVRGSGNKRI
jgi:hypothetical protein